MEPVIAKNVRQENTARKLGLYKNTKQTKKTRQNPLLEFPS